MDGISGTEEHTSTPAILYMAKPTKAEWTADKTMARSSSLLLTKPAKRRSPFLLTKLPLVTMPSWMKHRQGEVQDDSC